jgi:hypothetical protein
MRVKRAVNGKNCWPPPRTHAPCPAREKPLLRAFTEKLGFMHRRPQRQARLLFRRKVSHRPMIQTRIALSCSLCMQDVLGTGKRTFARSGAYNLSQARDSSCTGSTSISFWPSGSAFLLYWQLNSRDTKATHRLEAAGSR